MTRKYINDLAFEVIGAAIEVHREMGKGLLESAYHLCLKEELELRNIKYVSECRVPFDYKGKRLNTDFRCDLLIEDCIIVELKAAANNHDIWKAQLLTYMKLLECPKGLLINFNSFNLYKDGTHAFVNEHFQKLPEE